MRKKSLALKNIIQSRGTTRFLEAHDGLSARLVESSGFEGVWASGFSISTALGVRDSSEVPWTEFLRVVQYINDCVDLPVLFDADSGHGDFNITRTLTKKLCVLGVAGMAIEDKLFPKQNSFSTGPQTLESKSIFTGKIKAAQDCKTDPDFCVIARTEALIAGHGVDEAIDRCQAYVEAGADAIFIHSKHPEPDEIIEFAEKWKHMAPLVVAPTTYNKVPFSDFDQYGVSIYLCANHMMRAAAKAMYAVAKKIHASDSLNVVDHEIATVKDIFDLFNYDELNDARDRYCQ